MSGTPLRIAIVAGEVSGDLLGAHLIEAIKAQSPDAYFYGIGGPKMIQAGFNSLFPMERLSVMGVVEVAGRLPELLGIRKRLVDNFLGTPPDVFIGIDSPDFVLPVALRLKQSGIKTVHYVSPSVWAWRQGRVHKIKRAVDLMLTLFPFEADFYTRHDVPVKFVGHPLASIIDRQFDHERAKQHWGYEPNDRVIAVLPGSRAGELNHMAPLFADVMCRMHGIDPRLKFAVPLPNAALQAVFNEALEQRQATASGMSVLMVEGHSREVMGASDAVLVTSGTATLEAMLLKRPMVVAYRWGAITHALISSLVKTDYISLPNLLADEPLVPEFVQRDAKADDITSKMMTSLNDLDNRRHLMNRFDEIHESLQQDSSVAAATAILELLEFNLG